MTDRTRGVLFPDRLPRFTRITPDAGASALAAWFWIPQWDLPPGVVSRQPVLAHPAANLVVDGDGDGVTLWGATTRASERVLQGRGWAVGAVLRPAALARLHPAPADLVDAHAALDEPALIDAVSTAMPDARAAAAALSAWLIARVGELTPEGRLANAMADLLMGETASAAPDAAPGGTRGLAPRAVLHQEEVAEQLRVSVRTLQRLAHRTVGISPAAMIRRRRLQEAAQRVRDDPGAMLADIAAELGYADQAHLARDFRAVLGFTASDYRSAV